MSLLEVENISKEIDGNMIVDGISFLQPILLSWLITHIATSQIPGRAPPDEW